MGTSPKRSRELDEEYPAKSWGEPVRKRYIQKKKKWPEYHKSSLHKTAECYALKTINPGRASNKGDKRAVVIADRNSSQAVNNEMKNVTGENRDSPNVTAPDDVGTGEQETMSSACGTLVR